MTSIGCERTSLSVSVVNYYSDSTQLARTLHTLVVAATEAEASGLLATMEISLVNNGGCVDLDEFLSTLPGWLSVSILHQKENLGFGRAHNVAVDRVVSDFHLILNPDVELARDSLSVALTWITSNPGAIVLAPKVVDPDGNLSYLCREKPTLGVLFLRAIGPACLRMAFRSELHRYEMRDIIDCGEVVWDPPVISGCFMFFRTDALKALGGFDPGYFLYFEDYDLSHRAALSGRKAYVPAVRITHAGGGAARKGIWHILMFCRSAVRYFASYGFGRRVVVRSRGV